MKKILLLAVLSVGSLFAQVKGDVEVPYIAYEIKMGQGFDAIQANCLMCHSFGYMINQGPQSKEFWAKKVDKMITHFKAPITDEDAKICTEYLFEHYGNGKLK
ncbi:sulfite:cytochrome C oxidoreductase subunit B [Sulfurimonas marina]|uniref:Sulfite:cytochrome C oxidoreductase subunit B n=1 Tax=Sulfurimonas marina TaxID=2590551 RepID=A0A7M1AVN4_9BACT|nr:sulfite:cytochrome C oxidoreductase subunit B [Sulfurimonas marina]QOP41497.1 sulfite:cytochrome C oxidoreductase subunit B [Sulfurimonas marina]